MLTYSLINNLFFNVLPIALSLISFILSIITAKKNKERESYLTIDDQYQKLLDHTLSSPILRDPVFTCHYLDYYTMRLDKIEDPIKRKEAVENNALYLKYHSYAYMMWNFLETIFDFTGKKKNSGLRTIWLPVLCEENKLNYCWFRNNKRLFRKEFIMYVENVINEMEIVEGKRDDFKKVYSYMQEEFPVSEMKDKNQMMKLLVNGKYKLYIARFKKRIENDEDIIGYALGYQNDQKTMFFLDYINILDDNQNCGYGSVFLKKLMDHVLEGKDSQGVFFEMEPVDGVNTNRSRRNKFYSRLGAQKLKVNYKLPYKDGSVDMNLMCIPFAGVKKIDKELIKKFISETILTIHSDFMHTSEVINSYIDDIQDFVVKEELLFELGNQFNLDYIYENYEVDFDKSIKEKKERLIDLMESKKYNLHFARNNKGDLVGFTFTYKTSANSFLFLDYLSVKPFYQHQGYGSLILKKLKEIANNTVSKGIICELPSPINENEDIFKGLIEKNEGFILDSEYFFPNEICQTKLRIAFFPNKNVTFVDKEEFKRCFTETLLFIHKDIVLDKSQVKKYLKSIKTFDVQDYTVQRSA